MCSMPAKRRAVGSHNFLRYPPCEISRRASSRPARASHAAAAARAVGAIAQLAVSTALHVAVVLRAWVPTQSPCECSDGRRHQPRSQPLPQRRSRTFQRFHQSWSMRGRWRPASSTRVDCQPAACYQGLRQVQDPAEAWAPEAEPASARDVVVAGRRAPAGGLTVASTGRAESYPPRVSSRRSDPSTPSEAMTRKIQGTVLLEAIVTRDGCPSRIRVVRPLAPGGLDEEAIAAAAQWQFEPGRLGAAPVDVLVMIDVGFWIR